jgi:membrane associated rhomboid family serine protease
VADDGGSSSEVALRRTSSPRRADDWALVLMAEGVPARLRRDADGLVVLVPEAFARRADETLARYEAENPPRPDRPAAAAPVWPGATPANAALAVSVALVVFFVSVTGPRDASVVWFALGSADAARIVAGEWWRAVTALTLHADLSHVLSNAVIGGFFVAWVLRVRGPGLGLLLVVLAGALGNLANAWARSAAHVAVGASTSGFGAVGVLAGYAMRARGGTRARRRPRWLPFAAGLGILAMFGSGAATDVWAHLFGFFAGTALGAASASLGPRPPGKAAQVVLLTVTLGLIALSWRIALG